MSHDHSHHHHELDGNALSGGHDHHGGHSHAHGHSHVQEVSADNEKRVAWALAITTLFMLVEIIAGIASNSLALVSDGVHMLSDAFSLGLALVAFRLARRPADARRSYGYQRMQVLAAFTNGVFLLLISAGIGIEAIRRLFYPEGVGASTMLVVALIGLCVNALSFWVLQGGERENLNMRGAVVHVMGDLLGSAAAIIAALIILMTGLEIADPLLSLLACVLIVRSSISVLKGASHLLLEGTPDSVRSEDVRKVLTDIDEVVDVHDLHLWGLTEKDIMLSAHLRVAELSSRDQVLAQAQRELGRQFGIYHATLQIEGDQQPLECGAIHP